LAHFPQQRDHRQHQLRRPEKELTRIAFVQDCNRNGAESFKQRTFHLCILTMVGRDAVVRIYRAYSSQEEIRAKLQNLTEPPAIHRSTY
jgi:hypothetical protein